MIRSDKDILSVLHSSLGACAIYDSPDLHISYASAKMLQLWNCDESAVGQRLEDSLQQQELLECVSKLKQIWSKPKSPVEEHATIKLNLAGEPGIYNCRMNYQPLISADGEIYGLYHAIALLPDPIPAAPQVA